MLYPYPSPLVTLRGPPCKHACSSYGVAAAAAIHCTACAIHHIIAGARLKFHNVLNRFLVYTVLPAHVHMHNLSLHGPYTVGAYRSRCRVRRAHSTAFFITNTITRACFTVFLFFNGTRGYPETDGKHKRQNQIRSKQIVSNKPTNTAATRCTSLKMYIKKTKQNLIYLCIIVIDIITITILIIDNLQDYVIQLIVNIDDNFTLYNIKYTSIPTYSSCTLT